MAAVLAVLVAIPVVSGVWPATDQADRSAAQLREAALASVDVPFSGAAESVGTLALPAADELDAATAQADSATVADLLSSRTTMRVWWRSGDEHRVDVLTSTGETDTYTDAAGRWVWEYEDNRATRTDSGGSGLDIPTAPDLLPGTLGRRLLSEADPSELSRTGAARIAGRTGLGISITPAAEVSSVARVDVWVDADTGLPLGVQVVGRDTDLPALDTRLTAVDLAVPTTDITTFRPPATARVRTGGTSEVLSEAARRLPLIDLPDTLAGLPRRADADTPDTVALYGRGVTALAVVPLPGGLARDLSRAADLDPTTIRDDLGVRLATGPLGYLLTSDVRGRGSYLVTGTVTVDGLAVAAGELPGLRAAS
ncbi:transcriptional regulator [Nakamurella flava]|uniref:Transcriptional regulator n=1 Tax=Nakamurella flava TaxID=2576308 RepID=A0A4U6Q979_9ACTN|nr:transcriptional regulator [Nakamurella flava]